MSDDLALVQDWLCSRGYSGEAKTVMDAMDFIARLTAELAAERERVSKRDAALTKMRHKYEAASEHATCLEERIAKLREALVKAREALEPFDSDSYPTQQRAATALDAVLKETRGKHE